MPALVPPLSRRVLLAAATLLGCAIPPAIPPSDLQGPSSVADATVEPESGGDAPERDELERRLASFAALLEDPRGDPDGAARLTDATAIAAIADARAVPLLRACMRQPADVQPVAVHRRCAEGLGRAGDPAAIEDMVIALFTVPDAVSTGDLTSEVMLAVARIGEGAVAPVAAAMRQTGGPIADVTAEAGYPMALVDTLLAGLLGSIGSPSGIPALVEILPPDGCPATLGPDADPSYWGFATRQIGLIGDPAAVDLLCSCTLTSYEPGLMFEAAQSLGWIGGPEATACLLEVIAKATYADDPDADPDDARPAEARYELRGEAGRFAVLAAPASSAASVRDAFDHAAPKFVRKQLEPWRPGLALLDRCAVDAGCYATALADRDQPVIVREKAAVELARLRPGDAETGLVLARAFAQPDPDLRLTLALALRRQMGGTDCSACAEAMLEVLNAKAGAGAEPGTMEFGELFAVIVGRQVAVGLGG